MLSCKGAANNGAVKMPMPNTIKLIAPARVKYLFILTTPVFIVSIKQL